MRCSSCKEPDVKPPQVLCEKCIEDVGGHAFLICVRCHKTWGILNREDGTTLFPVISGKTYRTTACTTCCGPSVNFKIIEETEARSKLNFAEALESAPKLQREPAFGNPMLPVVLLGKLMKMQSDGIRSKPAYDVAARLYVNLAAANQVIKVLRCGTWLVSIIPGRGGRAPSIDAVNLEDL